MSWEVLLGEDLAGMREQQHSSSSNHAQQQQRSETPGVYDNYSAEGSVSPDVYLRIQNSAHRDAGVKTSPWNLSLNTQKLAPNEIDKARQELSFAVASPSSPLPLPALQRQVAVVSECLISDSEYDYEEAAEHGDASSFGVSEDDDSWRVKLPAFDRGDHHDSDAGL
jgi:hypothetical protein